MENIKLIDNTNRGILVEGRTYQMGFGFAKRVEKDTYELVTPISCCKDYLNDVVWSEAVNKPIQVYGLSYKKQDIYNEEYAYLIISILTHKSGEEYPNYKKDIDNLEENYKRLEAFINSFEEALTEGVFTEIVKIEHNKYLVKVPLFFTKAIYLISLYSLLLRAGQFWDGIQDPQDFVDNFKANLIDVSLVKGASKKLRNLVENGYVEQNLEQFPSSEVHNSGILSFNKL